MYFRFCCFVCSILYIFFVLLYVVSAVSILLLPVGCDGVLYGVVPDDYDDDDDDAAAVHGRMAPLIHVVSSLFTRCI